MGWGGQLSEKAFNAHDAPPAPPQPPYPNMNSVSHSETCKGFADPRLQKKNFTSLMLKVLKLLNESLRPCEPFQPTRIYTN